MDWLIPSAQAQAAAGAQPNALLSAAAPGADLRRVLFPADPPAGEARQGAQGHGGRRSPRATKSSPAAASSARSPRSASSSSPSRSPTACGSRCSATGHQRRAQGHPQERLSPSGADMHSYPAWKIWLVAIVLLVALVLALPNVFGEAPALQLSRNDRTAGHRAVAGSGDRAIAQGQGRRRSRRPTSRATGWCCASTTSTQQLKARDAMLRGRLGSDYLVGAVARAAHAGLDARASGLKPMSLGLDLRGGVYFLYEVDVKGAVKQLLDEHGARLPARAARRAHPVHAASQNDGADTVRIAAAHAAPTRPRVAALLASRTRTSIVDDRHARRGRLGRRVTLTPEQIKRAPGLRHPAEHHHAAQPRQRARRVRADRGAPGRSTASSCSCPACRTRTRRCACSARPRRSNSGWSTTRTTRPRPSAPSARRSARKLYHTPRRPARCC